MHLPCSSPVSVLCAELQFECFYEICQVKFKKMKKYLLQVIFYSDFVNSVQKTFGMPALPKAYRSCKKFVSRYLSSAGERQAQRDRAGQRYGHVIILILGCLFSRIFILFLKIMLSCFLLIGWKLYDFSKILWFFHCHDKERACLNFLALAGMDFNAFCRMLISQVSKVLILQWGF